MSLSLFLLLSGVDCDFCLWLFLDVSVYLFFICVYDYFDTFFEGLKSILSTNIKDTHLMLYVQSAAFRNLYDLSRYMLIQKEINTIFMRSLQPFSMLLQKLIDLFHRSCHDREDILNFVQA